MNFCFKFYPDTIEHFEITGMGVGTWFRVIGERVQPIETVRWGTLREINKC